MTHRKVRRARDFQAEDAADHALAAARAVPPGRERTEALKMAGRLRNAVTVKRLKPERTVASDQPMDISDVGH